VELEADRAIREQALQAQQQLIAGQIQVSETYLGREHCRPRPALCIYYLNAIYPEPAEKRWR